MKKFTKVLAVALALVFAMMFSVTALAATGSEATPGEATPSSATPGETGGDFPWARVISFGVIIAIILAVIIIAKTNTKLGLRLKKFFKEYGSEIKKVSWFSKKDTLKATGIVLVILIVAAVAIGLLDAAFTGLIWLLASIF